MQAVCGHRVLLHLNRIQRGRRCGPVVFRASGEFRIGRAASVTMASRSAREKRRCLPMNEHGTRRSPARRRNHDSRTWSNVAACAGVYNNATHSPTSSASSPTAERTPSASDMASPLTWQPSTNWPQIPQFRKPQPSQLRFHIRHPTQALLTVSPKPRSARYSMHQARSMPRSISGKTLRRKRSLESLARVNSSVLMPMACSAYTPRGIRRGCGQPSNSRAALFSGVILYSEVLICTLVDRARGGRSMPNRPGSLRTVCDERARGREDSGWSWGWSVRPLACSQ